MTLTLFGFIFLAWLAIIAWLIIIEKTVIKNTKELERIDNNIFRLVEYVKSEEEAWRGVANGFIKQNAIHEGLMNILSETKK